MAGPPQVPAVTPRPPGEEAPEVEHGRLRRWLLVVGLIALLAAGAAGYAISEIESAKDENRDDDRAVSALREDLETLREEFGRRVGEVEGRVDDAADAQTQEKLQDDLTALDKRVKRIDDESGGGVEADELSTRIDDLEQRIEDLENDDSNN